MRLNEVKRKFQSSYYYIGLVCPGTNFLISPKQEKYVHPLLAKLIRIFRKPGSHYNGGSGKSLELSTSYSYSNGYPPSSEAPSVQSNMTGLNGTYTKRSSSLGRNLDVGPKESMKNGKSINNGYVNNGYKDT